MFLNTGKSSSGLTLNRVALLIYVRVVVDHKLPIQLQS